MRKRINCEFDLESNPDIVYLINSSSRKRIWILYALHKLAMAAILFFLFMYYFFLSFTSVRCVLSIIYFFLIQNLNGHRENSLDKKLLTNHSLISSIHKWKKKKIYLWIHSSIQLLKNSKDQRMVDQKFFIKWIFSMFIFNNKLLKKQIQWKKNNITRICFFFWLNVPASIQNQK